MENFTVKTKIEAEPRITKMLKRIERAFASRGHLFAYSFGDQYTVKKWPSGRRGKHILVPMHDLTITMSELYYSRLYLLTQMMLICHLRFT